MSYTNISKPTSSVYTRLNIGDKTEYDQPDIEYDDSNIFYDGVNQNAYTDISKPTGSVYTMISKPS